MTEAKFSTDIHDTEAQLFVALEFEALNMEIISIKQLQQHFSLEFNQAARFMAYLASSPMFEETTVLAAKPEYQDIEGAFQYLGLDTQKNTLSDYKQAVLERKNRIEELQLHFRQLMEARRLERNAAKKA